MNDHYVDKLQAETQELKFELQRPPGGWKRKFTEDEMKKLRPIAETFAMLDGNAFATHWIHYLQEADALYRSNGGDKGWAGECSWIRIEKIIKQDPACSDLWNKLQILLAIKGIEYEPLR